MSQRHWLITPAFTNYWGKWEKHVSYFSWREKLLKADHLFAVIFFCCRYQTQVFIPRLNDSSNILSAIPLRYI